MSGRVYNPIAALVLFLMQSVRSHLHLRHVDQLPALATVMTTRGSCSLLVPKLHEPRILHPVDSYPTRLAGRHRRRHRETP